MSETLNGILAGRYRLVDELGRGGMGAVYRAIDTLEGDRVVALKTIRTEGPITPALMLQFKEEFRVMTRLRHPNTVAVYDYGQLDDRTQFLTMEVVPGESLSALIARGPLALDQVYALLGQLLQALGFIHSRLYVHRDIKSQNVHVMPDGTLKLIDFGLMSQLGLPVQVGRLSGSPGYLPPELVTGGVLDACSDLYSVGCLAFELLTGRLPFEGKLMEVVRAHANQAPPPVRALRPDAPERLAALVSKLLAKEQSSRYQSAEAVLEDLSIVSGRAWAVKNPEQQKSYLKSSVLVGREAEQTGLRQALAEAHAGRGSAWFLAAPAGIGKSRLLEEFLLQAKLDDAHVLVGRCRETGLAPYQPLAIALKPFRAGLDPAAQAAVAPLYAAQTGHAPSHDEEKARLHQAITAWVGALRRERPIVLVLEDLHWADAQSLALFNHLIREAAALGIVCLGTFRNDETPADSAVWRTIEEGSATLLALAPFDPAQAEALLAALLGEIRITPEFGRFLVETTGGNPFFLTETLHWLMENGSLRHADGAWHFPLSGDGLALPASVEAVVLSRMAQVSEEAVQVARVAAVLGNTLSLERLLAVSKLPEERLFQDLTELLERQFLVKRDGRYAFPHDRMRQALYASLGDSERQALHQRCAEFIEEMSWSAVRNGDDLYELAHHYGHGRDPAKALHYLKRAGDHAFASGADILAVRFWEQAEQALAHIERPDRQAQLEAIWRAIGLNVFATAPASAIPALENLIAAQRGRQLEGPDDLAGIMSLVWPYRFLSLAYSVSGHRRKASEVLGWLDRDFQAQAAPPDSRLSLVRRACELVVLGISGRIDAQLTAARELEALLGPGDDDDGLRASLRRGTVLQRVACGLQGIRPREEDIALAYELSAADGDPQPIQLIFFSIVWYAWTGRQEPAEERLDQLVRVCRGLNAPPHPWVLFLRPYLLFQRGEIQAAKAELLHGLSYPHMDGNELQRQLMNALLGRVHTALGEHTEALAVLKAAEAKAREEELLLVLLHALLAKGELALAQGDRIAARRALSEARAIASDGPGRNPLHEAIANRLLGVVATAEESYTQASGYLERALAIVSAPEQDNWIEQGLIHQAIGDLYRAKGDRAAAASAYQQAGDRFNALGNRHHLRELTRALDGLIAPAQASSTVPAAAPERAPEERWSYMQAALKRLQ